MDFMLGAATAAHQVEGNNQNSDYWIMENVSHSTFREPSLDAVDHYNKYKEDIMLLKDAGCNTYRFSIEWARIEPAKGQFNSNEIQHYSDVLEFCIKNDITPIVTLHHFTSPAWLIKESGWKSTKVVDYFGKYTAVIVKELGEFMPYICTINEANMGTQISKVIRGMMKSENDSNGGEKMQVGMDLEKIKEQRQEYYMELGKAFGVDPRQINSFLDARDMNEEKVVMDAHQKAVEVIKELSPDTKVGLSLSIYDYQAIDGGEKYVEQERQEDFLNYLPFLQQDDFIGVQNYSRKVYDSEGLVEDDRGTRFTKMGYEYYPEGIGNVLTFVNKHWNKEIIVTENGISTDNDEDRVEFIERALKGVKACIKEKIPVIGYTYWSLLDNFEWQLGYDQTFGLIAVNRETQERFPKPSLSYLGDQLESFKKE